LPSSSTGKEKEEKNDPDRQYLHKKGGMTGQGFPAHKN
jgi:hypothetical protein